MNQTPTRGLRSGLFEKKGDYFLSRRSSSGEETGRGEDGTRADTTTLLH